MSGFPEHDLNQQVVEADTGDVILFLEATMHGSVPWLPQTRQRRSLIYRYLLRGIAFNLPLWSIMTGTFSQA